MILDIKFMEKTTEKDMEILFEYMDKNGTEYTLNKEYIYEFRYTPSIHESAMMTVSVHKTEEGAKKAFDAHKAEKLKEWEESDAWSRNEYNRGWPTKFGEHERWDIVKTEILE